MSRRLFAGLCVVAVGCGTTGRQHYTPPPEQLPPPADVGGALVVVDDQRPQWEREPFTGPISLFHLGRVKPNPWALLAEEAAAVVAAMPEKPARVTVTVLSFRLVKRDDAAMRAQEASVRRRSADGSGYDPNASTRMNYDNALGAQRAGDQRTANAATRAVATDLAGQTLAVPLTFGSVWTKYPSELGDHPPGASCALLADVQLIDARGEARHVRVQCFGAGQNVTGTAYWGEALEFAAKLAVAQFGDQFRQGLGMPAGK